MEKMNFTKASPIHNANETGNIYYGPWHTFSSSSAYGAGRSTS